MFSRFKNVYTSPHAAHFLGCMLIFGIVAGMYTGVLNNYLHEVLSITRLERGIVEFPRELPGLLLFVVLALLYRFSEMRLMLIALAVAALGLFGLWGCGDLRWAAIIMMVIYSFGEHLMMPIRQSVAMHMALPGKEGLAMGAVAGLGNMGQVIGAYAVPLLFLLYRFLFPSLPAFERFRVVFIAGAVVLGAGVVIAMFIKEDGRHVPRRDLRLRRKHLKYYILEVFFGARKQVFLSFAPYVLILNYRAGTELVSFLYGIWALANIFVSPLVGRLLDRFGYKPVIVIDAAVLTVLCLLYGFSHHLFPQGAAFTVVCFVFVLDAVLFVVGIARAMYVRTLCDTKEEVTGVLSSGISINHLVSIIIAVAGGLLWERLGLETLFVIAALLGLGSFVFSLTLPTAPVTGKEDSRERS
ncbi:MAG: MFS transporter [Spirochaetales bacterium]|nr:MFS transporter [Spirochaetales bacterium]